MRNDLLRGLPLTLSLTGCALAIATLSYPSDEGGSALSLEHRSTESIVSRANLTQGNTATGLSGARTPVALSQAMQLAAPAVQVPRAVNNLPSGGLTSSAVSGVTRRFNPGSPTRLPLPLPQVRPVIGAMATGTAGVPISAEVLAHPDVGGFLIHQGWKDIEIAKGVFDWSYIDGEFASAVANNKKTKPALHAGGDDAPKWLYDDGSIPFVLGKSGATFSYVGQLTFSGNTVSIPTPDWPGSLPRGKIIEIIGTPNNDGRYRITLDETTSLSVEEVFANETNVSGTVNIDIVPCYWDPTVIQHKSDFYNALIAHVQSLGSPSLNAMLNVPISMVDPNTGDWAFVNSPAHIASYNAAGWLTGTNAQKQAGWDSFDAAMRTLYDNVLPGVPATMIVGSAVGPVPMTLLPMGTGSSEPAINILAYVESQYPGKLHIAKGALNARSYFANPCPATGSAWEQICANPLQNFLQINWSVSAPNVYKANGDNEWDKTNFLATATVLKNAALSAYSYGALWFEIWHADVDSNPVLGNPTLQGELDIALAYIKDLFQNGVVTIGAPIAVQAPPPTITAPVGTEYVLEYVFDYNGSVPSLFEVKKDGVVVGNNLSHTIANPTPNDSGLYEISCGNSAGTQTLSTQITFQ